MELDAIETPYTWLKIQCVYILCKTVNCFHIPERMQDYRHMCVHASLQMKWNSSVF